MLKKILPLFITVFFSCIPVVYTVRVEPEYSEASIESATLYIAPVRNLHVDYAGNVTEALGAGDKKQLIIDHFKTMLLDGLKQVSTFSTSSFGTSQTESALKEYAFDLGDMHKVRMHLPADTTPIRFDNEIPDYVLFIEDLFLGTEKVAEGAIGSGGFGLNTEEDEGIIADVFRFDYQQSSPQYTPAPLNSFDPSMHHTYARPKYKHLRYKCEVAIWDNRRHKVVVYGRVYVKSKGFSTMRLFGQAITKENWDDVDRQFVRQLLFGTPFEKRSTGTETISGPEVHPSQKELR